MNNRILLVVGDKFASYVQGKDAITLSQLKGLLGLPIQILPTQGRTVLVPGQGMSEESIKSLLEAAAKSVNLRYFDFSLWQNLPKRAPSSLSHKHLTQNTLISAPKQLSEDHFELHILIDENCDLMSDHQTGQHVQGMILVEAVRQSSMAITQTFFLPKNDIDYAFVLNDMSVKYNNFTFPVAASIVCHISAKNIDNPRRLNFFMDAEVYQCGTSVSSLKFSITAMDKLRISKQESMQASKTHKNYLAQIEREIECLELSAIANHH
ncbi:MAG TPA: AfsA-related hotdog domain-containing protein [Cellvibrionaceae bacterium]